MNEKKDEKNKDKDKDSAKKEEKKPKANPIQERIKMMMLNNTKKPEETKKPAEKRKTFEASKNAMAERIKNMEASNNDKKQEKKEEPKKLNNNNFLNKLKQFQPGEQKKEEKPKEKPPEKPKEKPPEKPNENSEEKPKEKPTFRNAIMERLNKRNSQDTGKKNEPPKNNILNKFGGAFALKLAQMNGIMNPGQGPSKHRFSAMIPSSKMGLDKKPSTSTQDNNNSNNLGIINEEPDKLKEGYDPAENLQKTLDNVVIQKKKKKMKKPNEFLE